MVPNVGDEIGRNGVATNRPVTCITANRHTTSVSSKPAPGATVFAVQAGSARAAVGIQCIGEEGGVVVAAGGEGVRGGGVDGLRTWKQEVADAVRELHASSSSFGGGLRSPTTGGISGKLGGRGSLGGGGGGGARPSTGDGEVYRVGPLHAGPRHQHYKANHQTTSLTISQVLGHEPRASSPSLIKERRGGGRGWKGQWKRYKLF